MFNRKKEVDTDGLNEIIYLSKSILKLIFIILIISIFLTSIILLKTLGIFKFLNIIFHVISPIFIGFITAWLFSPLVDKLTKRGLSRIIASILVYLLFIIFLLIFFRMFIPLIYYEVNELIEVLPSIIEKISNFIDIIFDEINGEFNKDEIKNNILNEISIYGSKISSNIPSIIINTMSSLVSGIGTIFFGLVVGLYMLFDFDNVTNLLLKLIPRRKKEEVHSLVKKIGSEVRKCVNGTLLVACLVFILDTISFSIIGLNSPLLFGLFCGITDLIPYVGPYLGVFVSTLVGFTQSPLIGILIFITSIIVQIIESYILQPIVMSKATNLHPVVIILGLLLFGHFFGIIGMVLATPIMSIIKIVFEFVLKKIS